MNTKNKIIHNGKVHNKNVNKNNENENIKDLVKNRKKIQKNKKIRIYSSNTICCEKSVFF